MDILERRWCTPRVLMSTPSMKTEPASDSIMRNSARKMEDLPLPVRPTSPTLSPACWGARGKGISRVILKSEWIAHLFHSPITALTVMVNETPLSTRGISGRYLKGESSSGHAAKRGPGQPHH